VPDESARISRKQWAKPRRVERGLLLLSAALDWTNSAGLDANWGPFVDKFDMPVDDDKFGVVRDFIEANPELSPRRKGKDHVTYLGSEEYWDWLLTKFQSGRKRRAPGQPTTVPDALTGVILETYFHEESALLPKIAIGHSLSMQAENIAGDLLERYIAWKLESKTAEWIWCSGSVVKDVDFIRCPSSEEADWLALQVKNRDNSENAASSSVRQGTTIKKWHRSWSRTGETNWESFPVSNGSALSETDFIEFVREYLTTLMEG